MPKGVYPRASRGGIRTEITTEEVRPEAANARAVEVIRQSGGDDDISTTERLFGDLEQQKDEQEAILSEEPIVQNPIAGTEEPVKEPVQEPANPQPEVKPEEPKPVEVKSTSTPEEFLDLDKIGSMKVKAKIDGREENPTFREVLGQYQLKKHLNEAADRVGEERRKLAEERRQLAEMRQQAQMNIPNVPRGTEEYNQPAQMIQQNDPYLQRIQFLEQQLNQVVEGTKPAMYESNRQRVASELKGQGFNDFLDYIPKMESHIVGIQDPQLVQFYDSPMGAKSLYFQLKAQEANQVPAKQAPLQQSPRNIPPQQVPVTRIDSGSQPSSGMNDDGAFNYRQAFRRASSIENDSQRKDAWNEVLRQKGIIPDA